MRPESLMHLFDIQQAAQRVSQFVADKSLTTYDSDVMLRSAVERPLGVVGEALTRLRKTEPELLGEITNSRRIIDVRNLLVHGYDVIHNETVWSILQENVPILLDQVRSLIRRGDAELTSSEED